MPFNNQLVMFGTTVVSRQGRFSDLAVFELLSRRSHCELQRRTEIDQRSPETVQVRSRPGELGEVAECPIDLKFVTVLVGSTVPAAGATRTSVLPPEASTFGKVE